MKSSTRCGRSPIPSSLVLLPTPRPGTLSDAAGCLHPRPADDAVRQAGSAVALFLFFVVNAVEADRDADHQHVVLARSDVDAVGVPDPEPGA